MAGEVAFFELGVEDVPGGGGFYSGLLGGGCARGPWGAGSCMGGGPVPGGIHGGDKGAAPYLFFRVEDMDAALQRVRELGGVVEELNVQGDEASVAEWGRFQLCRDDQGSPFGLHQPPSGS